MLVIVLLLTPGPGMAQDILSGAERVREDPRDEEEDREERAEGSDPPAEDRPEEERGSWLGRNWPILAAIAVIALIAVAFAATSGTDDPGDPVLRFIPGGG